MSTGHGPAFSAGIDNAAPTSFRLDQPALGQGGQAGRRWLPRFGNTCLALCLGTAALLSGCASLHEPVPPGFSGPTAQVADSGFAEDGSKAQFFAVMAVDGKTIDNTLFESRKASRGQGFSLTTRYVKRAVPAVPMRVSLVATHQTAAPIHEIASRMAGTFFTVEGEVDFSPVAGGNYVVRGELKKEGSSVWIEDADSRQPVTEKVRSMP